MRGPGQSLSIPHSNHETCIPGINTFQVESWSTSLTQSPVTHFLHPHRSRRAPIPHLIFTSPSPSIFHNRRWNIGTKVYNENIRDLLNDTGEFLDLREDPIKVNMNFKLETNLLGL